MARNCPRCGLISPEEASRCDCGYDFQTRTVESSYLAAEILKRSAGAANLLADASRSHLRAGAIVVSLAVAVGLFSYLQTGKPFVIGFVMFGVLFLLRGMHERRVSRQLSRSADERLFAAMNHRLTDAARRAMTVSLQRAVECGASAIEPEHLLLAVLGEDIGAVGEIVARSGLSPAEIPQSRERQPRWVPWSSAMRVSDATQRALIAAMAEADLLGSHAVGPEHLLLGLVRQEGSVAAFALARRGLRLGDLRAIVAGH